MEKIKHISVDELIPYINNSRTHTPEQVDQIAASIKEFGFINKVITDGKNGIIAGHCRILGAKKLGMKTVPCIEESHLTEAQKKAYIIADNQLAMNAGWDHDLLKIEIEGLQDLNFDIDLIGFDDEFLDKLLEEEPLTGNKDDNDIPPIPNQAKSVPGDVWILGPHRLMVGDSTSQADVEKLMNGQKADLVWTDPPYNVAYEGQDGMTIKNDNMKDEQFKSFLMAAFINAFIVTKAGRPIYIAHADSEGLNFISAMKESGWLLKQGLIWVKNSMVMGRRDYQSQHEPILYGWKPGEAHKWYGEFNKKTVIDDDIDIKKLDARQLRQLVNDFRNQRKTTILRQSKPTSSDLHPTMKPVALVQGMIKNSSREEDVVLDLFGGSGTTMIACQKINRSSRLMEFDPIYADVEIIRWQDWTGDEAIHAYTGKRFNEVDIYELPEPVKKKKVISKEAQRCHTKLKRAIERGEIIRPDECEECHTTEKKIEGAHFDYEPGNELKVRWLCRTCHRKWDADDKKGGMIEVVDNSGENDAKIVYNDDKSIVVD